MTIQRIFRAALGLAIAVVGADASGQLAKDIPGADGIQSNAVSAETRAKDLAIQLEAAQRKLSTAKSRYEAGQLTANEFEDMKSQVARLELAMLAANKEAGRSEKLAAMTKPVNVQFKEATVAQAAESLSKASNLSIHVAPSVSTTAKITLDAQAVPVATVLESIALQLNLRIAPTQDGDVELQTWPQIEVNGQKQVFPEATRPWSSEWREYFPLMSNNAAWPHIIGGQTSQDLQYTLGQVNANKLPAYNSVSQSLSYQNLNNAYANGQNRLPSPAINTATSNQLGFQYTSAGLLQGVTLTSIGNRVVVAEPGRGPHGEPGAWLTVYGLRGSELVKESSLFHPTRATLLVPADVAPKGQNIRNNNSLQRNTPLENKVGR